MQAKKGFTLVEVSIVLVIIGLIVGGIMVGLSVIRSARVRATISQISSYQSAVSAFYQKYDYLPGDIPAVPASNAGLTARGSFSGEGDGNGLIEGITNNWAGANYGYALSGGETAMVWVDLSAAGMLNANFSTATSTSAPTNVLTTSIGNYLPSAAIGGGNFIYAWSTGGSKTYTSDFIGGNMFGISQVTCLNCSGITKSNPGLTVAEAYNIDSKIDDGYPQTGNVAATFIYSSGTTQFIVNGATDTSATAPTTSTCYDNGNVAGARQQYSMGMSNGKGQNCGLSFKMQAGEQN